MAKLIPYLNHEGVQELAAGHVGILESVYETIWPCPRRQALCNSPRCPVVDSREGDVMDPAEGAVLPWLERHTPSGSSQRTPGAVCQECVLMGPTLWIGANVVCHQPFGGRSLSFCFGRFVTLGGYVCPVAAYKGAPKLSARAVGSGGLCARVALLHGLDTGSQDFLCLTMAPRGIGGCLLGLWAQGACVLDWCNCNDRRSAAE